MMTLTTLVTTFPKQNNDFILKIYMNLCHLLATYTTQTVYFFSVLFLTSMELFDIY